MKRLIPTILLGLMMTGILTGVVVFAEPEPGQPFEVTITNLTRGQKFTPVLVASHQEGIKLFTLGSPASSELATLAEEGDTMPLNSDLSVRPEVWDVATSMGLLGPGQSVTVTVEAGGKFNHFSVAAMLIPTNDGFFAINGVQGPTANQMLTLFSPAYDAGSEPNDELCANIPGPDCGGTGLSPGIGGEDFVHIHAGIHGIMDLQADERDWRNPVAKITIRRIR